MDTPPSTALDTAPNPPSAQRRLHLFPLGLLALVLGGAIFWFGQFAMGISGLSEVTADENGELFAMRRGNPEMYRAKMHEVHAQNRAFAFVMLGGVALGVGGIVMIVVAPMKRRIPVAAPPNPSSSGGPS